MGNRKVKKGKSREEEGRGKEEGKVMNIIKKIDKNEKDFLEFMCASATPSDEEMNTNFIPQPRVDTPSIDWCLDGNLTKTKNPEWGEAWDNFCILKEYDWFQSEFMSHTEKVQKESIEYMVDFVRKTQRSLMYKKYAYALQKKKKEEDEIDELKRQVEYIESHKDKGKTTMHGGGESTKSGGESGERKMVDEAKEDEGVVEVVGAEKKEKKDGVKEKVAGDDTTIHGGGERVKSGGESGEEKTVDEVKVDEAVVEVDDTLGFLVIPGSIAAVPSYEDGDNVARYRSPFSLKDWLLQHRSPDSRWLLSWPDMGLKNVHWTGDRLKRESLPIMQSLLSAVLDYHEHYGPHGNLSNHANIILSQRVDSFGGSQKVWFQIQLLEPNSLEPKILNDQFEVTTYLTKDMLEIDRVFREILEGRDLDVDMQYLLNILLKRYPFTGSEAWRTQVLRNFPGFWYGQQRASFPINVYYNWMCDSEKSPVLLRAIQGVRWVAKISSDLKCIDWIQKISTDSIFYEMLIFTRKVSEDKEDDDPKPQYSEASAVKVLKYMRDTLHHYQETHVGGSMKICQIELYLSNLFKGFILALYMSMCEHWIFLG